MLSVLVFLLSVLLVGGVLFLLGSVLLGRGETQPPADPDRSPVELPADRPVTADDVRALRVSVTVRGYRMTEVDWLLDQLAGALEERDAEIAALRARDGAADDGRAAGPAAPETTAPGATTPETTAPGATAPETTAPGATAPRVTAPSGNGAAPDA